MGSWKYIFSLFLDLFLNTSGQDVQGNPVFTKRLTSSPCNAFLDFFVGFVQFRFDVRTFIENVLDRIIENFCSDGIIDGDVHGHNTVDLVRKSFEPDLVAIKWIGGCEDRRIVIFPVSGQEFPALHVLGDAFFAGFRVAGEFKSALKFF